MKWILCLLAALTVTAQAGACGIERWAVKSLTDPAARSVNFTPTAATVAELNALPELSVSGSTQRLPAERRTYRITATLVKFKLEADQDIHLILSGGGKTMIAEMPLVSCTYGAQHRYAMLRARQRLEAAYGAVTGSWRYVNQTVTVTGVLFFDVKHGQSGVADNGVELHPVVGFR